MMFSSKTPRDLNHDPEPWHCPGAGEQYRIPDGEQLECDVRVPRPEFDHVQHNPPNPLLRDTRDFWPVILKDWIVALDDPNFIAETPAELGQVTGEHVAHARTVLTRLAALQAVTS